MPTLANAIVIMSAYLAAASLVWGFADATMDQPLDLEAFDAAPPGGRVWRVAHLSDIHIVGERYGFRIESGRGGPRGNERVRRVMARLEAEHAARPLDLILITGDMTDAGRSAEWAQFFAHSSPAIRSWQTGCSFCQATTTSTSSIGPTRRASICRSARRKLYARCGRCQRWRPSALIACTP